METFQDPGIPCSVRTPGREFSINTTFAVSACAVLALRSKQWLTDPAPTAFPTIHHTGVLFISPAETRTHEQNLHRKKQNPFPAA